MKKKTILATILCALIMTGCGGNAVEQPFVPGEVDDDVVVDEDNVDVDPVDDIIDDDTYDSEIQGGENVDGDLDDDVVYEGQMLTAGNVNELVGTWYEADVLDARTLTISEDGSFTLEYRGGGALYGTIEVTEEENPDGTTTYWYMFLDQEGEVWEGLAVPDEGIEDDLYFGQGGDPHFVSEASLGIKAGADYVSSGNGATADDFLGMWVCDRCSINIMATDDAYQVDIMWGNSADLTNCWQYICVFDEDTETLVCKRDGVSYQLDTSDGDQVINDNYSDGTATFTLSYGLLYWQDDVEDAGAGMDFEYNPVQYGI